MRKKDIVLSIITTIGLAICMVSIVAAKWGNNIDLVYYSAIGLSLCFGGVTHFYTKIDLLARGD